MKEQINVIVMQCNAVANFSPFKTIKASSNKIYDD